MIHLVTCIILSSLIFCRLADARLGENRQDESTFTEVNEEADPLDLERELKYARASSAGRNFTRPHSLGRDFTKMHDKQLLRVMVGFKNNEGLEQVRGTGSKWIQNMRNLKISTFLVTRQDLKLLQSNPNIV
jgi:hypothetical protein